MERRSNRLTPFRRIATRYEQRAANHHLLDGIVSSAVALIGLALAVWLERRRTWRTEGTHALPATGVSAPRPEPGS